MSTHVSANYRELLPEEVAGVAAACAGAWKSDAIPNRQYETSVKAELEHYRNGGQCAPFDALGRCFRRVPLEAKYPDSKLLDVGASGGYYLEVLRHNSVWCEYTACDFNPAFKILAEQLYPEIDFDVADARNLPYGAGVFDIVMSGGLLMHTFEYEQAIAEMVRVSRQFVILHRTPVLTEKPTKFFTKSAYGMETLEVHFGECELFNLFGKYGLSVHWQDDVFFNPEEGFGHRNYVLRKDATVYQPA